MKILIVNDEKKTAVYRGKGLTENGFVATFRSRATTVSRGAHGRL
jgi:hypothetical protein